MTPEGGGTYLDRHPSTVAIPATGVRINLRMFSLVDITCLDLMILLPRLPLMLFWSARAALNKSRAGAHELAVAIPSL